LVEPAEIDDRLAIPADPHIVKHARPRDSRELGEHCLGVHVELGQALRLRLGDRGTDITTLQQTAAGLLRTLGSVAGAAGGLARIEVDEVLGDERLLFGVQRSLGHGVLFDCLDRGVARVARHTVVGVTRLASRPREMVGLICWKKSVVRRRRQHDRPSMAASVAIRAM
jgi:hypothetical protein